jgi:hypothetical protein
MSKHPDDVMRSARLQNHRSASISSDIAGSRNGAFMLQTNTNANVENHCLEPMRRETNKDIVAIDYGFAAFAFAFVCSIKAAMSYERGKVDLK